MTRRSQKIIINIGAFLLLSVGSSLLLFVWLSSVALLFFCIITEAPSPLRPPANNYQPHPQPSSSSSSPPACAVNLSVSVLVPREYFPSALEKDRVWSPTRNDFWNARGRLNTGTCRPGPGLRLSLIGRRRRVHVRGGMGRTALRTIGARRAALRANGRPLTITLL